MDIGKGVNPEKAAKAIEKFRAELVDGETVQYFAKCNNMKPLTDAIVVTNARILGLSGGTGYKFKARFNQISRVDFDEKSKSVRVDTADGDTMTFKAVAPEDMPHLRHCMEAGRENPPEKEVLAAFDERRATANPPASEEEQLARFGRLMLNAQFGMRSIRIYEKGYVRVSGMLGSGSKARFERLVAIEATSDVAKKTGLGRGVAAVATGGLNLLGSNKRGDVYLTIKTDENIHVLHEDPPTAMNLRTVKRLESTGQAVLAQAPVDTVSPVRPQPAERSTRDRLRELQSLHADGFISEEEYGSQRERLLREL